MTFDPPDHDESYPEWAYRQGRSEEAPVVVNGLTLFCEELEKFRKAIKRKSSRRIRDMSSKLVYRSYECPLPEYGWSCGYEEDETLELLERIREFLQEISRTKIEMKKTVRYLYRSNLSHLIFNLKALIGKAEACYDQLEGE
ncbi:hypothetical protein [Agrobacterium pusense]|uniref:hypothetical protein n=1 Tax=Agrobacterium pusense TaxID=648995 RepID=UPI001C6EF2A1|nr:hypothetical protein [Agrobacterium pusense]MBW9070645.1 hypothetical protein [Agrobacterium pusense]MBW9085708.1 hypothetical protein [Agrobacterium pusense]MBW9126494.1 hypothetical protein [Agrobacterium pusense]MBW9138276.1 hypothetical protein [Agrobacterium pusense]